MKFLIAFLVLVMVAISLAKPNEVNPAVTKEGRDRFKAARDKCQQDPATAVPERPENAGPPSGPPPANQGAHVLCISKGLKFQNEDGSINKHLFETKGNVIFAGNDNVQAILDECLVAQETPEATADKLIKCYFKYSPKPPKPQN